MSIKTNFMGKTIKSGKKAGKKAAKKAAKKYTVYNLKNKFDDLRLDVIGARKRKAAAKLNS